MKDALDGNAAAGALAEVFAPEMTVAVTTCATCGDSRAVGELHADLKAPGLVLRCAACNAVQARLVRSDGRAWLDLRGIRVLAWPSCGEAGSEAVVTSRGELVARTDATRAVAPEDGLIDPRRGGQSMNAVPHARPAGTPAYYLGRSARVWLVALGRPIATVVDLDRTGLVPDSISVPTPACPSGTQVATGV